MTIVVQDYNDGIDDERARILEIIDKCVVKWDKAKIVYVEELKKEIENGD